jgi:hypothetical protein
MAKSNKNNTKTIKKHVSSSSNAKLAEKLQVQITKFETNSRFDLLAPLDINSILGRNAASVDSPISLENVCDMGAKALCTALRLSTNEIHRLLDFFSGLDDAPSSPRNQNQSTNKIVEINSIEARNRLLSIVFDLRSAANFSDLIHFPVSKYWQPDWPRAPFEESLTISQICSIDIENLLRKRSLGPAKVTALILALESALTEAQGQRKLKAKPRKKSLKKKKSKI